MLALFTDFGYEGPYVGQIKAVLARHAPNVPVIDLMHDAPRYEPVAAGYMLAATVSPFAQGSVFISVVDPGVGTARRALVVRAGGMWFTGPDNGLFDALCQHLDDPARWEIRWRPERLSESFHGRDLFAPVAAGLALGRTPEQIGCRLLPGEAPEAPADWPRVIYIDGFGNLVTGMRGTAVSHETVIEAGAQRLTWARTFGEAEPGAAFWYVNSSGLVELAVNQGSAADALGLEIGDPIEPMRGRDAS